MVGMVTISIIDGPRTVDFAVTSATSVMADGARCAKLSAVSASHLAPDGPDGPRPRALAMPLDGPDESWDVEEKLGSLWRAARLGPTVERLRRHILQGGERTIEPGQFRTLDAIAAHGPCPVRELAIVIGVEPSTVTRATRRLEDAGWIEKRRSQHDQREVLLDLTPAGAELHAYFVARAQGTYNEIFTVFSQDEHVLLADLLERMLKSTEHVLGGPGGTASR
jgi:DNA-binding MarR family transcriptional regulator